MNLIKQAISSFRDLLTPSHNIREVIPGWDDDYPDPTFTDNWELTCDIDLNEDEDYCNEIDTDCDSEFSGFNEDETQYLKLINGCTKCNYFHGTQYNDVDLICGIHPYGNANCPDFESKYSVLLGEDLEPEEETVWLTEEDELRAQYKHYYEFASYAVWKGDSLDDYLGEGEI
jgi:hypothetical protein